MARRTVEQLKNSLTTAEREAQEKENEQQIDYEEIKKFASAFETNRFYRTTKYNLDNAQRFKKLLDSI